jgi:hypothetical protein
LLPWKSKKTLNNQRFYLKGIVFLKKADSPKMFFPKLREADFQKMFFPKLREANL